MNLFAHTEAFAPFPAYVTVNRETDGRLTLTVRERGHNGTKTATIEMSAAELIDLSRACSVAWLRSNEIPTDKTNPLVP